MPNRKAVSKELARREVLVDYRPRARIRVAPHFHTTDEELEYTIQQISVTCFLAEKAVGVRQ